MTERQYKKWCRKYKRKITKECKNCGVRQAGAFDGFGDDGYCGQCLNKHQQEVNAMKNKVNGIKEKQV